jgi:hypothetical protein
MAATPCMWKSVLRNASVHVSVAYQVVVARGLFQAEPQTVRADAPVVERGDHAMLALGLKAFEYL